MKTPRILALGGSLRAASYNQKLAAIAADAAEKAGAEVTLIALRDFRLPVFDEDLEAAEGKSEAARKLKQLFSSHDGFIIASPEYNSSISGALKNAIDWVSRADADDESPASVFKGKSAAILAASPSGLGGQRGLVPLRSILENIGTTVLPGQVAIPKAYEAFDADGNLKDAGQTAAVRELAASLVRRLASAE